MKILDRYSMFEVLAVCLTFKFLDDDYKSVALLASESDIFFCHTSLRHYSLT